MLKNIPFIFKIIIPVAVIFFGASLLYLVLSPAKTPPLVALPFVDPFPEPLPPRVASAVTTVALNADATIVPYGGSAVISWASLNANSCTALESWEGAKETSGTYTTGPLTSARTYDIKCRGADGESEVQSITVNVIPLPVGTLSATLNPVPYGGSTTLKWVSSSDTDSCVASGGWEGNKKISGSEKISGLASSQTYALICTGAGGERQSSVAVKVIPLPRGDFRAEEDTVPHKGTTVLAWSFSDATSCTASGGWSGAKKTVGTESVGPLTTTRSYSLKCTGRGGTNTKALTIKVGSKIPVPKGTLRALATTVPYGGSTTLTWVSSADATSCTASGGWEGAKATSGTEIIGPLKATQKYTLACRGPGGEAVPQSATVIVRPQTPTGDFYAESATVPYGARPALSWSSVAATSCTASGGWSGAKESSGTEVVNPITRTTTYMLGCRGQGGLTSKSLTVTVIPLPTGTLRADPNPVPYNQKTNVSWSASADATSCTASGGWEGAKATSGTEIVGPLTASLSFVLSCTGPGGASVPRTLVVNVSPKGDLSAESTEIKEGTAPILKWSSSAATSCTASGGWEGAKATSGTETVEPITRPVTYKIYSLKCTGPGGTTFSSVTVKLISLPAGTLRASVPTVAYGEKPTLTWSASGGATSCTASGGWEGVKATSGTETVRAITSNTTYALVCTGSGGDSPAKSVVVKVLPSVGLSANPNPLRFDQQPTLSWESLYATSCTGTADGATLAGTSGSHVLLVSKIQKTYTIKCTGEGGYTTKSVVVERIPPPIVTWIKGERHVYRHPGHTHGRHSYDGFSWSSEGATLCIASGAWGGEHPTSGLSGVEYEDSSDGITREYIISCTGPGGTTSKSIRIP